MVFHVTKWYLDVCAPDGTGAIVYAARIQWRQIRISYVATLEFDATGKVEERMTLRGFQAPWTEGPATRFQNGRLDVSGTWTPLRDPTSEERQPVRMLATEAGSVEWKLAAARSHVRWQSGGREIEGLGYAERLELTLPPWELPIRELHWGRFVAPGGDAAWIEWRGPHPLRLTWRNGQSVEEHGVELTDPVTLRDGPLVQTVFSKVPVLKRSLPMTMLQVHETKWRSRGVMLGDDGQPIEDWAIHEVVKWG